MWLQVAAENIWNQLKASVRIFYQAFITTFQRFIVLLGIFWQKHLIDAFTDLWSTLMNALNLKMYYNDNKAISEIFMIKQKFAMQNMRSLIWQFFDNEIERNIVLAVSWYSTYSMTLVSFVFLRDLIFKTILIMMHRRYEVHMNKDVVQGLPIKSLLIGRTYNLIPNAIALLKTSTTIS